MTKQERRAMVREMANLLRSDLYERVTDPEPEKGDRAVWQSPLGHQCIYAYDQTAERQPIRCELVNSQGQVYATSKAADVGWLDRELL